MSAARNRKHAITRRSFITGIAGAAAMAVVPTRRAHAQSLPSLGPIRHAHFQSSTPDRVPHILRESPVAAFGPAAAALFAQVLIYAQSRLDTVRFVSATLQHDAAAGEIPRHLVLSARFSDGGTATFAVSPHVKGPATGTVRLQSESGDATAASAEMLVRLVTGAAQSNAAASPLLHPHPEISERDYNAIRDVFLRALS